MEDQIRQAVDHIMQNPLIRDFQAFQDDFEAAGSQSMGAWEESHLSAFRHQLQVSGH
ncbi:hypothetical protein [Lactiplantibacillus plantarum]|uniref:hypothetical protein n=1 Tax=Lactiplantibacillus plantarum TaxID=1590 RepID=UPI003C6D1078